MNLINKTFVNITDKVKGNSLKARSTRGAMILGVGTVLERALRLVRNMILARILVPDEFGLMAIVLSAVMAIEAFVEVGVKQSVIHNKRGAEQEYLNVAWWFQTIRGIALFLVAFLAAPLISSFYENPRLLVLLRVAFVSIALNGLMSPRVHVLEKKIEFGKWVFLYQGSGLVGTLVGLGIALFAFRSVWALLIGFLAEGVFRCLLSFVLCPFLPRMHINRENLGEVLKYARRMLGVPILAVIAFRMDILVLGKVVSAEQVGMYWLALQLALQTSTLFSKVVYPILLPAFAEKQDDKGAIRNAAMKITTYTSVFGIPIVTFLVVCATPILSIIYGSRYGVVAVPFALLCIHVLVRIQGSILSQIYFAIGKPNLHRRFVMLRLAILVCLMYPAIKQFGLVGSAAVVLLANSVGLCMQVVWMHKSIGLRFGRYAFCWVPGLKLAAIVLVPALMAKLFDNDMFLLNIIIGGLACLVACAVGLFSLGRNKKSQLVESGSI
ncbi:MAG: oligosaccharide flippase family protein [Planctomycetota bacterium]